MSASKKKLERVLKDLGASGDPRPLLIEHVGFEHPEREAVDRSKWPGEWTEPVEEARFLAQKAGFRVAHVVVRPNTPLKTWRAVAGRILVDYEGLALVLVRAADGLRWLWSSPSLERRRTAGELREGIRHITVELSADGSAPQGFLALLSEVDVTASTTGLEVLATVSGAFDTYTMALQQDIGRNAYEALRVLSEGLVSRKDNALTRSVTTLERIRPEVFILLYRFLFVLYAEAREIFPVTHPVYLDRYSLAWWRENVTLPLEKGEEGIFKAYGGLRGTGLWERCKDLFSLIKSGADAHKHKPSEFSFRAYYGTIFDSEIHPNLLEWDIPNEQLADAVRLLTRFKDEGGSTFFVDYSSLEVRHLGSIYERLLEYHLTLDKDGCVAHTINTLERKSTGSYFTPTALISRVVADALSPILEKIGAEVGDGKPTEFEARLYSLRVCDPAMGSGHFLVGVLDHLTRAIIEYRCKAGLPDGGEDESVEVRRTIVRRCLYGVDRNELAVELAKMSLWLETVNSQRPLSFLDAHLKPGNSLVGSWFDSLADPQRSIFGEDIRTHLSEEVRELIAIERHEEMEAVDVQQKVRQYRRMRSTKTRYGRLARLLDAQIAKHFGIPLEDWRSARELLGKPSEFDRFVGRPTWEKAVETARRVAFFHWELEFPEVFYGEDGRKRQTRGFDAIVGNPPWDRIRVIDKEFFRFRAPEIAHAQNAAAIERELRKLEKARSPLWHDYQAAIKDTDEMIEFLRSCGDFPRSTLGPLNYYSLFLERSLGLAQDGGYVGMITPTGLLTDFNNHKLLEGLHSGGRLISAADFENKGLFPDIDDRFRFSLLALSKGPSQRVARFAFQLRDPHELDDSQRWFKLASSDAALFCPNTRTIPTFKSRADADLNQKMYRAAGGVLRVERDGAENNPWGAQGYQMVNMASDSGEFRMRVDLERRDWRRRGDRFAKGAKQMIPLYEAKMIHLWNSRFATYHDADSEDLRKGACRDATSKELQSSQWTPLPRYWVPTEFAEHLWSEVSWPQQWAMAFRDIARATDERTAIVSFVPRLAFNHKAPVLVTTRGAAEAALLVANLSSIPFDYCARNKISGTNLSFFVLYQLPAFRPEFYDSWALDGKPLKQSLSSLSLALSCTYETLRPLARDAGHSPEVSPWDEEKRFADMRLLDAIYARLYGLTRDEFAYILDTFPIVRANDIARWGRFRTKEDALKAFDGLEGRLTRS